MKRSFEIADLIVAFIKGEISREDLTILDEWMAESEENKALFVSFMDEVVFANQKKQPDPEQLEHIFQQMKMRKQQIRRRRRIRLFSSVAASVVLLFSVLLYFNDQDDGFEAVPGSTITVGKQMAYLLLPTGEKVVLQEHQQDTITTGEGHRQIILDNGRVEISGQDSVADEEYHVMEIPRGAEYKLTLSDGTRVWLNADSKLRFPAHFNSAKRYVELSGEAYFEVTRDELRPFIVHTDEVDVKVLGTEFCIRNYADKPVLTTLVRGSVEVTDQQGWQSVLKPGQQSVTSGGYSTVRNVETLYYTAWKDGYFIFENTPLAEIMEELSLWYNCQYFFQNPAAAELRITARLKKYDEIDVLLGILSKTNEIRMEKKGNAILIKTR